MPSEKGRKVGRFEMEGGETADRRIDGQSNRENNAWIGRSDRGKRFNVCTDLE